MAAIFVSYRREDSRTFTGRVCDRLRNRFGRSKVFLDSDILQPGQVFRQVIEEQLAVCRVVIVIIGNHWLHATDQAGHRRFDDSNDFIRLEVGTALQRKIPIIPLLVDDAQVPRSEELPTELTALPERQALAISHHHFDEDIDRLIQALEKLYGILNPVKQYALVSVSVISAIAGLSFLYPLNGTHDGLDYVAFVAAMGIAVISMFPVVARRSHERETNRFRLAPSFSSGLQGGLIGGAVAGIITGIGYYLQLGVKDQQPRIIGEIILYALIVGAITGSCSQLTIGWFRYVAGVQKYSSALFNEVTGGGLGGALGGILFGALGGFWFGQRDTPAIDRSLLAVAPLVGSICVFAGIVLYESGGRWRKVVRSCLVPLAFTPLIALAVYLMFQLLGIDEAWFHRRQDLWGSALDGAILGIIVGFFMGVQIGSALLSYRRRQRASGAGAETDGGARTV